MKAFFKKYKSPKHPFPSTNALVSNPGEPATSTSTNTGDPRPFVSTGSATVSAQVIQAADITVNVQHKCNHSIIVVDQTSQLGVSASMSTSAIDGIASVAHVEEHHDPLSSSRDTIFQSMDPQRVSYFPTCFLASVDDQQNQYSELSSFSNAPNILVTNSTFVSLVSFFCK